MRLFQAPPNHEAIYSLSRITELAAAYNVSNVLEITGKLDVKALVLALRRLVEHHEALRSAFYLGPSGLVQSVQEDASLDFRTVSFRHLSADAREERFRALARYEARRPFELHRAPLHRFALVEISRNTHRLIATFHHLVVDGWSLRLILQALIRGYHAALHPAAARKISEPEISMVSEALAAQRQAWSDVGLAERRAAWIEHLKGAAGRCEVPSDKARGIVSGAEGAELTLLLEARLSRAVFSFSRQNGCSPFATLAAAFKVLLYKYGADPDGLLRVPFANRKRFRKVCGFFVNTLPVRCALDSSDPFYAFLGQFWSGLREASLHQSYPGTFVEREIRARSGHEALATNGTIVESAPLYRETFAPVSAGNCRIRLLPQVFTPAPFALSFSVPRDKCPRQIHLIFNEAVYGERFVRQLSDHYPVLLENLLRRPHVPLSHHALGGTGTKKGNMGGKRFPRLDISGLIERQWKKTPDRVAIVCGEKKIRYRELGRRVEELASRVDRAGLGRDDLVGVEAVPRARTVMSLLAILRAGAAFVPIGPRESQARRNLIAKECGARFLFDEGRLLPWGKRGKPAPSLPDEVLGRPAYVLFTSGSTGAPKGVLIEERNLLAQLSALSRLKAIRNARRFILLSPLTFDASLEQVFLPLISGGTLFLPGPETLRDPGALWGYVKQHRIEVIDTVPSLMNVLLEAVPPGLSVPLVIFGAEPLDVVLLRKTRARLRPRDILNTYGPTETTINATVHDCSDGIPAIGSPLPGYRTVVLDRDRNPVPPRVVGELFIGGPGVGRGYLGDMALTRRKFVELPQFPGSRFYASGDLARADFDQTLHFVGRSDDQLKVYGVRIEPAEIVHHLLLCTGVRAAKVRAVDGSRGQRQLVAYLETGPDYDERRVREKLRRQLPAYLVPGALVVVPSIPLMASGKCDWSMLPALSEPLPMSASNRETSRSAPTYIAELFRQTLRLEREVEPDEDFFSLGGHSLSVMELIILAEKEGVTLRASDVYEGKTPAKIAAILDSIEASSRESARHVTCPSAPRRADLPSRKRQLHHVLLTGATGFFGAHLLQELVHGTGAKLHCLVRAPDDVSARKRLAETLVYYFGATETRKLGARVSVVAADLTEERMGLPLTRWRALSALTDEVVHAAAVVKYFESPEVLHASNVEGTQRIIDFCLFGGARLAHVSTLGLASGLSSRIPYLQSKLEGEAQVLATEGLNASIFRVGNLTGRYRDGWFQANVETNAFYALLKAALIDEIADLPESRRYNLTPVDECSRALRCLLAGPRQAPAIVELGHPQAFTVDELRRLARERKVTSGRRRSISSERREKAPPRGARRPLEFPWKPIDGPYLNRVLAHMRASGYSQTAETKRRAKASPLAVSSPARYLPLGDAHGSDPRR